MIDGWTVLSAVLIVLVAMFATAAAVYTAANLVPHAIISLRKAKRHPMGYRTGAGQRQEPTAHLDEPVVWTDKELAGRR